MDWRYALLTTAILPGLAFISRRWAVLLRSRLRRVRGHDGELWGLAQEVLAALPLVQACGRERRAIRRFTHQAAHSLRAGLVASGTQAQFAPLLNVLIGLGAAVVTWYGALRVLSATLTREICCCSSPICAAW